MKPITRTHTADEVVTLFESRYTCKAYDPDREVSAEDLHAIVEAARLSPSSMGLEPWHLLVIPSGDLVDEIFVHCWGAHPAPSHVIVFLGMNVSQFHVGSGHIAHIHADIQGRPVEDLPARYQKVNNFITVDQAFVNDSEIQGWIDRQVYIALANVLTAAAMLGVDSTAIEGMVKSEVVRVLEEHGLLDSERYHLLAIVSVGYTSRDNHRPKTRRPPEEVITFVKA